MKWIKASERNPDKERYYFSYRNEGKGYMQITFWYADKKEWSSETFEWLDEGEQDQDELWDEVGKILQEHWTIGKVKEILKSKYHLTIK